MSRWKICCLLLTLTWLAGCKVGNHVHVISNYQTHALSNDLGLSVDPRLRVKKADITVIGNNIYQVVELEEPFKIVPREPGPALFRILQTRLEKVRTEDEELTVFAQIVSHFPGFEVSGLDGQRSNIGDRTSVDFGRLREVQIYSDGMMLQHRLLNPLNARVLFYAKRPIFEPLEENTEHAVAFRTGP